eukprot:TRINITY_DN2467_c0_g1_i2.p1 TRINITY_DN2467_c0_g1~~TRINITY_DN2467_c0_g1_i2.p1  ORF type:complete len:2832 (+),score=526.79 TRINITY_DN2467_c0_g1_i2:983-8497(+)
MQNKLEKSPLWPSPAQSAHYADEMMRMAQEAVKKRVMSAEATTVVAASTTDALHHSSVYSETGKPLAARTTLTDGDTTTQISPTPSRVLSPTDQTQLQKFNAVRQLVLQRHHFLDLRALDIELHAEFRYLPPVIREQLDGLYRICSSVTSAAWALIRTSTICTLTDLEQFILQSNKLFDHVESFEELGIGPLHMQPTVRRHFCIPDAATSFPKVTLDDLWDFLVKQFPKDKDPLWDPVTVLKEFCRDRFGCDSLAQAGIRCTGAKFITWLLSCAKRQEATTQHACCVALRRAVTRSSTNLTGIDLYKTLCHILSNNADVEEKLGVARCFVTDNLLKRLGNAREDVAGALASLLLFAVTQTPPLSPTGHAIAQLASPLVVERAVALQAHLEAGGLVECLSRLEAAFFSALEVQSHADTPLSLVQFIAAHPRLCDAVNALLGATLTLPAESNYLCIPDDELAARVKDALAAGGTAQSTPLARLCAAEAEVRRLYDVNAFEFLRKGSFVEFCHANELRLGFALRTNVAGLDGAVDVHRARCVVRATLRALPQALTEFQRKWYCFEALRAHFGRSLCEAARAALLDCVENCGEFSSDCNDYDDETANCSFLAAAVARLASSCAPVSAEEAQRRYEQAPEEDRGTSAEQAWALLLGAPPHVDLARLLHWDNSFAPALGRLADFLQTQLTSAAAADFHVLCVRDGEYLRWLPSQATLHSFAECVERDDSCGSAECLLCMCASYGGEPPVASLRDTVANHLSTSTRESSWRFVVVALNALPDSLQTFLGEPVYVAAFELAFPGICYDTLPPPANASEAVCLWRLNLIPSLNYTAKSRPAHVAAAQPPNPLKVVPTETQKKPFPSQAVALPQTLLPPADTECSDGDETALSDEVAEVFSAARRLTGVDIDTANLSKEDAEALKHLREMATRSIRQLAMDLYSEQVHFLLELLQNADDNKYSPGVVPSLRIEVCETSLVFENNERGFTPADVLALCSIASSTKKGRTGFIGHKGIGWKSVFKICPRPEIHSRHFHFGFDITKGTLGYVTPLPLPPPHGWNSAAGTRIVLPVEPATAELVLGQLYLPPSLLLFLRRLRVVRVARDGTMLHEVSCGDASDGIVLTEERHGGEASRTCWVVSRTPTEAGSELVLAFPLRPPFDTAPPQQRVFAFLPLRSYGFRFIVHGDWEVTSSRESIDSSSPSNQRLREQLPAAFQAAVTLFVRHAVARMAKKHDGEENEEEDPLQDISGHQLISLLLAFVPLKGQLQEFFAPVVEPTLHMLRGMEWIPTAQGKLATPASTVLLPATLRDLEATAHYLRTLNLDVVHPDVDVDDEVASAVGINTADAKFLLQLLDSASHAWSGGRAAEADLTWLVHVLEAFAQDRRCSDYIDDLRRLRVFPLSDGSVASFASPIYDATDVMRNGALPVCLLSELRALSPALLAALTHHRPAHLLLKRLGLQQACGHEFVAKCIVPLLSSLRAESAEHNVAVITFAHGHSAQCAQCRGGLLEAEILRVCCGSVPVFARCAASGNDCLTRIPRTEVDVLFPACYLGEAGSGIASVEPLLPAGDRRFLLLSPLYLSNGGQRAWFEFFQRLGVRAFPPESSLPALMDAALAQKLTLQQSTLLRTLMEQHWDIVKHDAALLQLLRSRAWLPSTLGTLCPPRSLFMADEKTCGVLSDLVDYVDGSHGAEMLLELGAVMALRPSDAVDLLSTWSRQRRCLSPEQVAPVYRWIAGRIGEAAPADATAIRCSLGAVPSILCERAGADGRPTYRMPRECVWSDPAGIWRPAKRTSLSPAALALATSLKCAVWPLIVKYAGMQDVFAQLGVPEAPSLSSYLSLLQDCASVGTKDAVNLALRALCNLVYFDEEEKNRRAHARRLAELESDATEDEAAASLADQTPEESFTDRVLRGVGHAQIIPTSDKRWASPLDPFLLVDNASRQGEQFCDAAPDLKFALADWTSLYPDIYIKAGEVNARKAYRLLRIPLVEDCLHEKLYTVDEEDAELQKKTTAACEWLLCALSYAAQLVGSSLSADLQSRLRQAMRSLSVRICKEMYFGPELLLPQAKTIEAGSAKGRRIVKCCVELPSNKWREDAQPQLWIALGCRDSLVAEEVKRFLTEVGGDAYFSAALTAVVFDVVALAAENHQTEELCCHVRVQCHCEGKAETADLWRPFPETAAAKPKPEPEKPAPSLVAYLPKSHLRVAISLKGPAPTASPVAASVLQHAILAQQQDRERGRERAKAGTDDQTERFPSAFCDPNSKTKPQGTSLHCTTPSQERAKNSTDFQIEQFSALLDNNPKPQGTVPHCATPTEQQVKEAVDAGDEQLKLLSICPKNREIDIAPPTVKSLTFPVRTWTPEAEQLAQVELPGLEQIQAMFGGSADTGFLGERIVTEVMKGLKEEFTHVLWINERGESGKPYDVEATNHRGELIFVEVKTTRLQCGDNNCSTFAVSPNEIAFMLDHGAHCELWRVVLPADKGSAQVVRIVNPAAHFDQRHLSILVHMCSLAFASQ